MNPTNDPGLRSFVDVPAGSDFPIQNLPYGVFRPREGGLPRIGVAIGEQVLDLAVLQEEGLLDTPLLRGRAFFGQPALNGFMAAGEEVWREARARISQLLRADERMLRDNERVRSLALRPASEAEMLLPATIGDYTDFYASRQHATNVGTMFRGPENALMPNWLHLPVGYHGRASSIVVSGTDIRRPWGQIKPKDGPPVFGPSQRLDFELELGVFIGPGNPLGRPIPIDEAPRHIFGMVLVNDWSARDIQQWEYVPLGPFLGKNFATSISPWVVTAEALEPFRTAGPKQDPEPLPYLRSTGEWAYDIDLEVWLQPAGAEKPERICLTNAKYLYWNVCQQIAHHTVNGCNLRPGDLLASGTISGPTADSYGSMLELAWNGMKPVVTAAGVRRAFLQDSDTVTLSGKVPAGVSSCGLGCLIGHVLPAVAPE